RYCLTVTNPDGHPVGHACTRAPPPGLAPTEPGPPQGSPAPLDLGAWISGLNVNWLESGSCSHARETTGYVPGRLLGHLIKVRNPTCTAPGCRRPAQQCDVDHIVPYQQGGRTCECNLHPACRRHHRCKGSAGWRVEMPEPGVLVWRLPHGRSYLSRAQPYPV
ncbi:MAG: HNH endonuclease, partial [Actinobacteria bacterium]|nr:HNH endonuclease [Actinomycetota bacterium]